MKIKFEFGGSSIRIGEEIIVEAEVYGKEILDVDIKLR